MEKTPFFPVPRAREIIQKKQRGEREVSPSFHFENIKGMDNCPQKAWVFFLLLLELFKTNWTRCYFHTVISEEDVGILFMKGLF